MRSLTAAVLGIAIFVVNALTPAEIQFSNLYVLVLLVAGAGRDGRGLWVWTTLCLLATTGTFLVTAEPATQIAADGNFAIALASIGCTALLLSRQARAAKLLDRQSQVLDIAGSAILLRDHAGEILMWNRAAEDLYGWTKQDAVGRRIDQLLESELPDSVERIAEQITQNGVWEGEIKQRKRDGDAVTVFSRWTRRWEEGNPHPFIIEASVDAHTQRAAETLRLSELRYRTIFDTLAVAILEHDLRPVQDSLERLRAEGVSDLGGYLASHPEFVRQAKRSVLITGANDTAVKMLGLVLRDDAETTLDLILSDEDESFAKCLVAIYEGRPTFEAETKIRTATGEPTPVIVALSLPPEADMGRITGCLVDLSDRLRMQATLDRTRTELDHALRAASLGELSASIAHEVNQPLAAVMNYANASMRWMRSDRPNLDEARTAMQSVVESAQIASDVVKRIRKLLGKLAPDRVPMPIDLVVSDAVKLVQNEARAYGATILQDFQAGEVSVQGDKILLQQVLINVLNNAVQAMEPVTDRARVVSVQTERDGGVVRVKIADAGPGFTPESQARAFETFYTTKARGMGLGLAICRSTIEAHEGTINIEPAPTRGALVTISLPVSA